MQHGFQLKISCCVIAAAVVHVDVVTCDYTRWKRMVLRGGPQHLSGLSCGFLHHFFRAHLMDQQNRKFRKKKRKKHQKSNHQKKKINKQLEIIIVIPIIKRKNDNNNDISSTLKTVEFFFFHDNFVPSTCTIFDYFYLLFNV